MVHGSANPQTWPSPAPSLSPIRPVCCAASPSPRVRRFLSSAKNRAASAASSLVQRIVAAISSNQYRVRRFLHPHRSDSPSLPCSQPEPDFCSQPLPPFHNTASAASSNFLHFTIPHPPHPPISSMEGRALPLWCQESRLPHPPINTARNNLLPSPSPSHTMGANHCLRRLASDSVFSHRHQPLTPHMSLRQFHPLDGTIGCHKDHHKHIHTHGSGLYGFMASPKSKGNAADGRWATSLSHDAQWRLVVAHQKKIEILSACCEVFVRMRFCICGSVCERIAKFYVRIFNYILEFFQTHLDRAGGVAANRSGEWEDAEQCEASEDAWRGWVCHLVVGVSKGPLIHSSFAAREDGCLVLGTSSA
jgi:hypothetical protein